MSLIGKVRWKLDTALDENVMLQKYNAAKEQLSFKRYDLRLIITYGHVRASDAGIQWWLYIDNVDENTWKSEDSRGLREYAIFQHGVLVRQIYSPSFPVAPKSSMLMLFISSYAINGAATKTIDYHTHLMHLLSESPLKILYDSWPLGALENYLLQPTNSELVD